MGVIIPHNINNNDTTNDNTNFIFCLNYLTTSQVSFTRLISVSSYTESLKKVLFVTAVTKTSTVGSFINKQILVHFLQIIRANLP